MEIIWWIIGIYFVIQLIFLLINFGVGAYVYIEMKKEDKETKLRKEIKEEMEKELEKNNKKETNE